jgi:hypothetical protein
MEGSTLVELAEKKLDDLTERHDYFLSMGDQKSASFIADEGLILAEALENNHTFFCLPNLRNFNT